MTIYNKPDAQIFAKEAKQGEITTFPDIERGWGVTIATTNGIPPMEYFNAIQNRTDQAIGYLMQRGVAEWREDLEYPKHAITILNGQVFFAKQQNANRNPLSNPEVWVNSFAQKANLSDVYTQNETTRSVDTIEDLKKLDLKEDDVVQVLGYYSKDDGATHKRVIKNQENESSVKIQSGLFANLIHNNEINVSWFGATGGGKVDDSPAIQKAISYANSLQIAKAPADTSGSTYTKNRVKVKFNNGNYLVSNSIILPQWVAIEAEGYVYIHTDDLAKYVFTSKNGSGTYQGGYQLEISGFICYNSKGFLYLDNQNLDQGMINIFNLELKGLENAIYIENAQSSRVAIHNFKSDKCKHFLINKRCDHLTVRDGWISQGKLTEKNDATITHENGVLFYDNIIGVPTDSNAVDRAWINLGDGVSQYVIANISNSRFGGETGSCAIVNNNVKYDDSYPRNGNGFSIKNCQLYSVDKDSTIGKSCLVRFYHIPNSVCISGNVGAVDTDYILSWHSGNIISSSELPSDQSSNKYLFNFNLENNNFSGRCNNIYEDAITNSQRLNDLISSLIFNPFKRRVDRLLKKENGKAYFKLPFAIKSCDVISTIVRANLNVAGSGVYKQFIKGFITTDTAFSEGKVTTRIRFKEQLKSDTTTIPSTTDFKVEVKAMKNNTDKLETNINPNDLESYSYVAIVSGYSEGNEGVDTSIELS